MCMHAGVALAPRPHIGGLSARMVSAVGAPRRPERRRARDARISVESECRSARMPQCH